MNKLISFFLIYIISTILICSTPNTILAVDGKRKGSNPGNEADKITINVKKRIKSELPEVPDAILLDIFSYLGFRDLLNVSETSKKFYSISSHNILWQIKAKEEHLAPEKDPNNNNQSNYNCYNKFLFALRKYPHIPGKKLLTLAKKYPNTPMQLEVCFAHMWTTEGAIDLVQAQNSINYQIKYRGPFFSADIGTRNIYNLKGAEIYFNSSAFIDKSGMPHAISFTTLHNEKCEMERSELAYKALNKEATTWHLPICFSDLPIKISYKLKSAGELHYPPVEDWEVFGMKTGDGLPASKGDCWNLAYFKGEHLYEAGKITQNEIFKESKKIPSKLVVAIENWFDAEQDINNCSVIYD